MNEYTKRIKNFEDLFGNTIKMAIDQAQAVNAKQADLQRDINLSAAMRDQMISQLKAPGGDRDLAVDALADFHDEAVDTLSVLIKDYDTLQAQAINAWDTGKLNAEKAYYKQRIKELEGKGTYEPEAKLAKEARVSGDPHKLRALAEVLDTRGVEGGLHLSKGLRETANKALPGADLSQETEALSEALFKYGRMRTELIGAYKTLYFGGPSPSSSLGKSLARKITERGPDGGLKSEVFYDKEGAEQARIDYARD